MDVLILSGRDATVAIDVSAETQASIADLVERTADQAREAIDFGVVEVSPFAEFGPGDLADAITGSEGEVPSCTMTTQEHS